MRRSGLLAFVVVCIAALAAAGAYVAAQHTASTARSADAIQPATVSLAAVSTGPHIVFRNTALGARYGDVAVVSLAAPDGPRALTTTTCDRVYATAAHVLCLSSVPGVVTTYSAHLLDGGFGVTQTVPLAGIPSRARLSRDGRLDATTTFVAGDSYASTSFSTRTVIGRVGSNSYDNLEQYTLIHDGRVISPVDRNFWGVTFASDDDTFYVTAEWSGHTWLTRGSISRRTLTTLQEDAECPSLSPDGSTVVYKQRGDLPVGRWRLVRYSVATGVVTPLAETRSVDDQVEWLDNQHVVYGLARGGAQAGVDDVWTVPVDGSGAPTLLIPQAWSPAVVP